MGRITETFTGFVSSITEVVVWISEICSFSFSFNFSSNSFFCSSRSFFVFSMCHSAVSSCLLRISPSYQSLWLINFSSYSLFCSSSLALSSSSFFCIFFESLNSYSALNFISACLSSNWCFEFKKSISLLCSEFSIFYSKSLSAIIKPFCYFCAQAQRTQNQIQTWILRRGQRKVYPYRTKYHNISGAFWFWVFCGISLSG